MRLSNQLISKAVTIRDVAEKAGVSISLVSFVLNAKRGPNGEYICSASQQTARKIVEAAESLGYHANKAAATLRSGRTDTIGIIVSDISNACFGDITQKIENLAFESGYLTIISSSEDKAERIEKILHKFQSSGVDGAIIVPCLGAEKYIGEFMSSGIPVVLIDRDVPSLSAAGRVLLDNEKAGRIATRSLLCKGRRNIALIRYETSIATILDKEKGYFSELKSNDLTPRIEIVSRQSMDREISSAIKLCKEDGIDGFIFPSNTISIAGMSAIHRLGYSIPEDFNVVCFDQENVSGVYTPGVDFVDQPTNLVAEYAFRMLKEAVCNETPMSTLILNPIIYSNK